MSALALAKDHGHENINQQKNNCRRNRLRRPERIGRVRGKKSRSDTHRCRPAGGSFGQQRDAFLQANCPPFYRPICYSPAIGAGQLKCTRSHENAGGATISASSFGGAKINLQYCQAASAAHDRHSATQGTAPHLVAQQRERQEQTRPAKHNAAARLAR